MAEITRGTTPTITLDFPINSASVTKLCITFAQGGKTLFEKGLSDVEFDNNKVFVTLSEEETLSCSESLPLKIQIRGGIGTSRFASDIPAINVLPIIKDEAL